MNQNLSIKNKKIGSKMRNSNTFSILVWANRAKADDFGMLPLYARITVMGKRAEISLKKKVDCKKWNAKSGYLMGNSSNTRIINNYINEAKDTIWNIYNEMINGECSVSAEDVKERFTGNSSIRYSFLEIFDEHNKRVEDLIGKDYVKETLIKYRTIRNKLADFLQKKYSKKDIAMDKLQYSFITDFEHFLKTIEGINHNTAMSYIKRVKRIVNISVNNGWINYNPFSGYRCVSRKVLREELTEYELQLLTQKKFEIKRLEEVRDCFLFSCYTGYAFVDASKLSPQNIVANSDNELWIITTRTKTKISANVPLLPQAKAIIDKYNVHEYCVANNKILPIRSNQKMNAYLKEIADLCGISKKLTTHIARHTFATTVTLGNGVPIESVSKMLGHTKITTTQIYARIREQKVGKDMRDLKLKLSMISNN